MGVIQKQGFYFTIISYAGTVVGAFNAIYLYPRLLHTYQIGVFQMLISLSILYAQLSQAGLPTILSRFYREFKTDDKRHSGLITWIVLVAGVSFALSSMAYILLQKPIIAFYSGNARDFTRYYFLVIPLAGFTLSYAILDSICRLRYKSILSSFLNSFFLKAATSLGILLLYFRVLDFTGFLVYYTAINGLICAIIIIQLVFSGEFRLVSAIGISRSRQINLLSFGLFTLLGGATYVFLSKMDILILGHYKSESVVGVYSTYLFIVAAIAIPSQSLNRVSYQLVADAWARKDMDAIAVLYHKTSIVQMLFGSLLLIGVVLNRETLLALLHKPEFKKEFNAFYFAALATLVDITGGLNTYIISISHKYRISTLILVVTTLICAGMCYLLIPFMGASGAGAALLIAYAFLNVTNWLYIKIRFHLQPFNVKHLLLVLISVGVFAVFSFFPATGTLWLDFLLRTVLTTLVFGFLVIAFAISEDLNRVFFKFFPRLRPAGW